jgi:hypothetical protein
LPVLEQILYSINSQESKRRSAWRMVQYSSSDYSEPIWVYSKNDASCTTGKWRTNSISIKKCVSFTTVSITVSIPCMRYKEMYIHVRLHATWECTTSPKLCKPLYNSSCQKGDKKQIPYRSPTIRCHFLKFSHLWDLACEICTPLIYNVWYFCFILTKT